MNEVCKEWHATCGDSFWRQMFAEHLGTPPLLFSYSWHSRFLYCARRSKGAIDGHQTAEEWAGALELDKLAKWVPIQSFLPAASFGGYSNAVHRNLWQLDDLVGLFVCSFVIFLSLVV